MNTYNIKTYKIFFYDHFFGKNNYEIETKIFKHCEHRIPTEGSSLGLQFIKKHFDL